MAKDRHGSLAWASTRAGQRFASFVSRGLRGPRLPEPLAQRLKHAIGDFRMSRQEGLELPR